MHPKPWLKMWIEWIHDPKMLGLTLAETGAWWKLVTLSQQCVANGQLIKGNGLPLTLPEIANSLHISTPRDMKTLQSMIEKMEAAGSLAWNNHTLTVVHFAERQAKVPSESKEAIKERVRRHRERKTPLTTPTTVKEEDIEVEVEVEVEEKSVTLPLQGNGNVVTAEAVLAEIANLHEENFGIITPILSEKFKDFVKNYRGPLRWIKDAFAEAVTNNVRKWVYVETILDRWQQEGRQHGRRDSPGRGATAHKQSPDELAKAAGWKVGGDEGDGARDKD